MSIEIEIKATLDDVALLPVVIQSIRNAEQVSPDQIHMVVVIRGVDQDVKRIQMMLHRIDPPFPFDIILRSV